jgi:hypothetical protein
VPWSASPRRARPRHDEPDPGPFRPHAITGAGIAASHLIQAVRDEAPVAVRSPRTPRKARERAASNRGRRRDARCSAFRRSGRVAERHRGLMRSRNQ